MKPWSLKPVERHSTTIEGSWLRPAGYCENLSDIQISFLVELLESLGFTQSPKWIEGRLYRIVDNSLVNGRTFNIVQWKDMAFDSHNKDFNWKWEQLFKEEPGFEGFHAGNQYGI